MTNRTIITTDTAPKAVGAYSQAVRADNLLFVSGQLGIVPETGKLAEGGVPAQTRQALDNLEAILNAAGATTDNVVKTTILLADINAFKAVNEIYAERFSKTPPARAAYAVGALPLGARIEIEAIAVLDDTE